MNSLERPVATAVGLLPPSQAAVVGSYHRRRWRTAAQGDKFATVAAERGLGGRWLPGAAVSIGGSCQVQNVESGYSFS
jgi:hypothetical protein